MPSGVRDRSAAGTAQPSFPPPLSERHSRLLELLRERAYEQRDIVLASGRRSNFYIDCRRVTLTAEGHVLVGELILHVITHTWPRARGIGGMSLGADPLVSATALTSFRSKQPLDGFYVRKEAKEHGTGQAIEGASHLGAGAPVVILEDVVTSGGSALRAAQAARAAELEPIGVVAIVDRQEGGRARIEEQLPLVALFGASDFTEER